VVNTTQRSRFGADYRPDMYGIKPLDRNYILMAMSKLRLSSLAWAYQWNISKAHHCNLSGQGAPLITCLRTDLWWTRRGMILAISTGFRSTIDLWMQGKTQIWLERTFERSEQVRAELRRTRLSAWGWSWPQECRVDWTSLWHMVAKSSL